MWIVNCACTGFARCGGRFCGDIRANSRLSWSLRRCGRRRLTCLIDLLCTIIATYQLVALLDRSITTQTKALVLIDCQRYPPGDDLGPKMAAVKTVLAAKGIRLSLIIVKNGFDVTTKWAAMFLAIDGHKAGKNVDGQRMSALSDVMSVCDKLVLINYMASKSVSESAENLIFFFDDQDEIVPKALTSAGWRTHFVFVDLGENIPYLRFRREETATEQYLRFLRAAKDNCPPVSLYLQQKAATMYARWVNIVEYPYGWIGIRKFLKLFNSLHPDDNAQPWDTMDLRHLDVSILNNLTVAALHGCFDGSGR
ncbi:uncharacterized protein LOC129595262 [Paramacrobiotus metropolitanus]|uniref:uncharacterized protein LOC129595262 n=1 Tax=Paramacrobiotus metropolitanus TaxID=2943436 RepID=UPI002445BF50|nr:uncharacterized protein LOC129595262 [Paramacrobiotus metropolitanus]XP_055348177.1 uncharacterized protein LOC129595262 [Paramacrobiotus metropolitanus]